MKNLFLDSAKTLKFKQGNILEKLSQRHNGREHAMFDMSQDDYNNKNCTSTQFLQKKNQLCDLQESLERYCNILPVFGFNSAKYDLNLIKPTCYPFLLTNETLNLLSSRKRTSYLVQN